MSIFCVPNPCGLLSARQSSSKISSSESAFNTNTLQRERSAPLTSNEGFSVVAPIKIMLPFSTNGKKASCCALLNRWISSTKTSVFSPKARFPSASCITLFISFMPLVTAEKLINFAFVCLAITFAIVVFPTPGGPQKIIELTISCSIIFRSTRPFPKSCRCPTTSSNVRGRSLSANGCGTVRSNNVICPFIFFSFLS